MMKTTFNIISNVGGPMRMLGLTGGVCLSAFGCGGDGSTTAADSGSSGSDAGDDGSVQAEAGARDGGGGDGGAGDDAGDAGSERSSFAAIETLGSFAVAGVDDLRAVTFSASGAIYAAGFHAGDADDPALAVVRFLADGQLDDSFGDDGVVSLNLVDGAESAAAMVELDGGDLVVAANVDDGQGGEDIPDDSGGDAMPRESGQDAVLVRLDDSGARVDSFGDAGVLRLTFGWATADDAEWPVPTYDSAGDGFSGDGFPADTVFDLKLDASGDEEKLVAFGFGPATYDSSAATPRYDRDRYVLRVLASGAADTSFNDDGSAVSWDSYGEGIADNARRGYVESDGSIVSAGYGNFDGTNNVVLLRLLPDGSLDPDFGFGFEGDAPGAAKFNPFDDDGGMSEAYAVAQQSDGTYVTTGYGYATEPQVGASSFDYVTTDAQDLVAFGVTASGMSTSFGKQDSGAWAYQSEELAGASTEERGRDMVVLPDDRIVHVGYYGGVPAVYVALPDGTLDADQGEDGIFLYPSDDFPQQFFGVALSEDGTHIAAVARDWTGEPAHDNGTRMVLLEVASD